MSSIQQSFPRRWVSCVQGCTYLNLPANLELAQRSKSVYLAQHVTNQCTGTCNVVAMCVAGWVLRRKMQDLELCVINGSAKYLQSKYNDIRISVVRAGIYKNGGCIYWTH